MMNDMNYIDLFSGIGGFALGAYMAGIKFKNHYYSEVDKSAIGLYQKRFPASISLGDIKYINGENLKMSWDDNNFIISGGFPCQNISSIGNKEGINGEKSILWYEYHRLICEVRPRFAIIENVGQLASRGLDDILRSLAKIGYDAEWQPIQGRDVGAKQRRERIWIVAYRQGYGIQEGEPFFEPEIDWKTTWSIEPEVGGMVYGLSDGVDRLKGLGNSIIPQIACLIFKRIKYILQAAQDVRQ